MCAYRPSPGRPSDGPDKKRLSSAGSPAPWDLYENEYNSSPGSSAGGTMMRRGVSSRGGGGAQAERRTAPPNDKGNQIVQQFFWKAVCVIVQMRMEEDALGCLLMKDGSRRVNRWFNIELDEMEMFRDNMELWRMCDVSAERPPPVVLETYLDTAELTPMQMLVISDERGGQWDVAQALEDAMNHKRIGVGRGIPKQVVLERFRIELGSATDAGLNLELPVVYKKLLILFRALQSLLGLMPTWKFRRRLTKQKLRTLALKVKCRILYPEDLDAAGNPLGLDTLRTTLIPGGGNTTEIENIGSVESPVGTFTVNIEYRKNCDFRVDDSEAFLSSQFINYDEREHQQGQQQQHRDSSHRLSGPQSSFSRFQLHQRNSSQPINTYRGESNSPASLPGPQPYGSMSSYHQTERTSASPITALRAAAEYQDRIQRGEAGSSGTSPAQPSTLDRLSGSKSSLRSIDGGAPISRRGSIAFMSPFKSPSLSSSPAVSDPSYRPPSSRPTATDNQSRASHRLSIGTNASQSPRSYPSPSNPPSAGLTIPNPSTPTDPTAPRPQSMTRITSSFGGRRPRAASGQNQTADDASSSGQASYSSIPGNNGGGGVALGTSLTNDLDDVQDLLTLISEGQKRPPAFAQPDQSDHVLSGSGGSSGLLRSSRLIQNPLARFQKVKEEQGNLVESMSTSLLNLSTLPGSTSIGGSSISPSTTTSTARNPHTPAIPSRLSEASSADVPSRHRIPTTPSSPSPGGRGPTIPMNTMPRDIPVSPKPRFGGAGSGRSSSVSPSLSATTRRERITLDADLPAGSYDSSRQISAARLPLEAHSSSGSVPRQGAMFGGRGSGGGGVGRGSGSGIGGNGAGMDENGTGSGRRDASGEGLVVGSGIGLGVEGARGSVGGGGGGSGGYGRPCVGRTSSWSRQAGASLGDGDDDLVFAMSDVWGSI